MQPLMAVKKSAFATCSAIALILIHQMCAQGAPDVPSAAGSLNFGGIVRTYHVYRPSGLPNSLAVPLVVVLHGGYGTGTGAETDYHWDAVADAGHFAVVYPDGVDRSWNAGSCCGQAAARNVDDVGFLSALVALLISEQSVDRSRIYVTGMSNGAMMTYRFACEASIRVAAVGPVAGSLQSSCSNAKPTSVLAIHGLDDRFAPFNGGTGLGNDRKPRTSVPDSIAFWRDLDGCGTPVLQTEKDVTRSIAKCAGGRAVELITIAGAGHQWPGGRAPTAREQAIMAMLAGLTLDVPSTDLDATRTLWNFFVAHRS